MTVPKVGGRPKLQAKSTKSTINTGIIGKKGAKEDDKKSDKESQRNIDKAKQDDLIHENPKKHMFGELEKFGENLKGNKAITDIGKDNELTNKSDIPEKTLNPPSTQGKSSSSTDILPNPDVPSATPNTHVNIDSEEGSLAVLIDQFTDNRGHKKLIMKGFTEYEMFICGEFPYLNKSEVDEILETLPIICRSLIRRMHNHILVSSNSDEIAYDPNIGTVGVPPEPKKPKINTVIDVDQIPMMQGNQISINSINSDLDIKSKATVASVVRRVNEVMGGQITVNEYPDVDAISEVDNSTVGDKTIKYVDLSKNCFVPIKFRKTPSGANADKFDLQNDGEGNLTVVKKKLTVQIETLPQLEDHLHNYFVILIGLDLVGHIDENRYLSELRDLASKYPWSTVKEYDIKRRMRIERVTSIEGSPKWGTRCEETYSQVVIDKVMARSIASFNPTNTFQNTIQNIKYPNNTQGKGKGKGMGKPQNPCSYVLQGKSCPYGKQCIYSHDPVNIKNAKNAKGGKGKNAKNKVAKGNTKGTN